MLNIKEIKKNPDFFKLHLQARGENINIIDDLLLIDEKKNSLKNEIDQLRNEKNKLSKIFSDDNRKKSIVLDDQISDLNNQYQIIFQEYQNIILSIPNITKQILKDDEIIFQSQHESVKTNISYMECNDILSAANISGSKFLLLRNSIAKLERALINKMIEINSNIYTEYSVPVIVNKDMMYYSAQLPKFKDGMFQLTNDQYLIPTGEVPLIGILKDMKIESLPLRLTAMTPCFRSEAGGVNDGLIRVHQFNKVELIHVCTAEHNDAEFNILIDSVKKVIDFLKLPYRILNLSNTEIGFHASQTYDFEVWMPSKNQYVEISSCSMCNDFQSRRMNLKYEKQYLYTLNGSGLAVGRTIAAIIENHCIRNNQVDENAIQNIISNLLS